MGERFLLVAQFVWGCFKIGNPTNALGMVELSNNNFKISGWLASEPSPSFFNKSFATSMYEWVGENPAKQREKKGTHFYTIEFRCNAFSTNSLTLALILVDPSWLRMGLADLCNMRHCPNAQTVGTL